MASTIVLIASMITTVGCLIFMIRGINRPLAMACYAVAMLPFQISCPFISSLKVNELAIIIWLVVFCFHTIRRTRIAHSRYAAVIFVSVLLISAFNAFKYFQSGNSNVITELIRLIVAIAFPLTVSLSFFNEIEDDFKEILLAWNISASIISALSLLSVTLKGYSFVSYVMSYITAKTSPFYTMKFAASPFVADPNSYGGYLAISIGIAYAAAVYVSGAAPSPAFSFKYGDRAVTGSESMQVDAHLKVTVESVAYPQFNAVEWVLWFENPSAEKSAILSEIRDGDFLVSLPPQPKKFPGDIALPGERAVVTMNGCVSGIDYATDDAASAREFAAVTRTFHPWRGKGNVFERSATAARVRPTARRRFSR